CVRGVGVRAGAAPGRGDGGGFICNSLLWPGAYARHGVVCQGAWHDAIGYIVADPSEAMAGA
ncbi:MAG: hypothetical protein ABF535_02670, partial [Acetobacter sp.]